MFIRLKSAYLFCVLLLSACLSYAQQDIRFNHLSMEDGLPNNSISCILQDSTGFVWIGTGGGLCMYDGNTINTFTHSDTDSTSIANNRIECIYEDNLHTIWVGTYFGLSKFNRVKRDFTNYYFDKSSSHTESSLVTNIIQDDKGMLWVATGAGIYKSTVENPHFSLLLPLTGNHYGFMVHGLASTKGGRIFLLRDTALLYTDDHGKNFKTAVTHAISDRVAFTELYYDKSDGHLWFGMYGCSQAFEFDPKTSTTKKYTIEPLPSSHSDLTTSSFCRLNDSTMLVGCLFGLGNGEGCLALLDTKRNVSRNYVHQNENPFSLSSGNTYCILKDFQNTFWIGTDVGINRFNAQQLNFHWVSTAYCKTPGIEDFSIRQLCYDKTLWLGSLGQGMVEYNLYNQNFSWYPLSRTSMNKTPKGIVFSLYPSGDTLWLGVRGGFIRFDINTHKYDTTTLAIPGLKELYSNTTRGISKDLSGTYWFGAYMGGIFSYNPIKGVGTNYSSNEPITRSKVRCMTIDAAGNKWVGTYDDGFYKMEAMTNQVSWNIPGDRKETVIARGAINDIFCDKNGNTYIATQLGGLILYAGGTKTFHIIKNDKWPADNTVNKIVEDKTGKLWLATGKGLSCWDLKGNTFSNYPEGNPLASMVNVTGCAGPDGNICFAGNDELLYFNPEHLKEAFYSIHPEITSVSVMNKNYMSDITQPLSLSYRDNYISFTFSAFDFLNEQGDQFAYYLDGFDKDWNFCGNRHFASYTNLPGGNYTLKLKVQNTDGTWIETSHPIHIHVTTPYYKTWWFFLLCGIVAFGLGYLFYYLQIQRELEAERLRTRLARDLHDDVGSSLSSISIISNMASKKQDNSPEESQRLFTKISETSQKTLDSISDLVWTLNPENDLMEDLFMRMRVYLSEILEAKEIAYEFNVPQEIERLAMSMDKRKNLYLVFKEAINNIAKYAKCTKVIISVKQNGNSLEMEIKDNGIGFIEDQLVNQGNGLKNMKQRATQMNGSLIINSAPGKGTSLSIKFRYT